MAALSCAAPSLKAATATRSRQVAAPVRARRTAVVVRASGQAFPQNWLRTNPLALGLGVIGWTVPSTIGVSGFGGQSLFGLFTQSIGEELAHFPTPPALTDSFWLYLLIWHVGLFTTMTLAQIGLQGRGDKYW